ncbi:Uncharacterised protein [Weissella viridescens]|uniref:Uncharacterized protein n=1 Tax=Weissella viridescens TaxID=1629 RepID=A0A380P1J6_WEIVI|nr:Uncharacterised protein [Weissella viridescens]
MFALKHHSAWQVSNPFTEESLYDSFGLFGGVGGVLALGVAVILFSKVANSGQSVIFQFCPHFLEVGKD